MKFIIYILCLFALFGCNCDNNNFPDPDGGDNFIRSYRSISELSTMPTCYDCTGNVSLYEKIDTTTEISILDFRFLLFDYDVVECTDGNPSEYCFTENNVNQESQDKFEQLAEKYNDTDFKGTISNLFHLTVIADVIQKIDVIADKDYNSTHKVGNSLADIITIKYISSREYIENDYSYGDTDYLCDYSGDPDYCNIAGMQLEKSLTEFNQTENYLIGVWGFELSFTIFPEKSGVYTFRVRYQETDGTDLTTDVVVNLIGQD